MRSVEGKGRHTQLLIWGDSTGPRPSYWACNTAVGSSAGPLPSDRAASSSSVFGPPQLRDVSNLLQGTQLKPTLVVSTALLPLQPALPLLGQFPAADPEAASSSSCLLGTMFWLPSLGVDTAETTGAARLCESPGQAVCACKAPPNVQSRLPEKRPQGPLGRPLNCRVGLELIVSSPHCGCLSSLPSFSYLHQGKLGPAIRSRKSP